MSKDVDMQSPDPQSSDTGLISEVDRALAAQGVEQEHSFLSEGELERIFRDTSTPEPKISSGVEAKEEADEAVQTTRSLYPSPKLVWEGDLKLKVNDAINDRLKPMHEKIAEMERKIIEPVEHMECEEAAERNKDSWEQPKKAPEPASEGMLTPSLKDIQNITRSYDASTPRKLLRKNPEAWEFLAERPTKKLFNTKRAKLEPVMSKLANKRSEVIEIGGTEIQTSVSRIEKNELKEMKPLTTSYKEVYGDETRQQEVQRQINPLEEDKEDSEYGSELDRIFAESCLVEEIKKNSFTAPRAFKKEVDPPHKIELAGLQRKPLVESNRAEDKFNPSRAGPNAFPHNFPLKGKERKTKTAAIAYKENEPISSPVNLEKPVHIQKARRAREEDRFWMSIMECRSKGSRISGLSEDITTNRAVSLWLTGLLTKYENGSVTPSKLSESMRKKNRNVLSSKELAELDCPCICSGVCTLCEGRKKLGVKEMQKIFTYSNYGNASLDWTYANLRFIQWKISLRNLCLGNSTDDIENIFYQLWKRYKNEFVLKKYSFLHRAAVENKALAASHCVLLIAEIHRNAEEEYVLELSDGRQLVLSTEIGVNNPLHALIRNRELKVGNKIHLIGAELIAGEKSPCGPLSEWRLKLNYNQIAKVMGDAVLGLHMDNILYKPIALLSPYGGPIFMLDVKINAVSIYGNFIMLEVTDYIDAGSNSVTVFILDHPDKANGIKKGMRVKIFNTVPSLGSNDKLEIDGDEKTLIVPVTE